MSLTRKRKPASPNSSSPWSKTRKKEETEDRPPVSQSATCIAEKNATATGQRTVPDAASSTSQSPRHSCPSQQPGQDDPAGQGDIALSPDQAQDGEEPQPCSSPSQHPLLAQEDSDMSLVITLEDEQRRRRHKRRRKGKAKRKRGVAREEGGRAGGPGLGQEGVGREEGPMEVDQIEVEIDRQLDRELESKSRQHNLTSVNVRNIIHEVITNEHVVAMMKAAISETEAMPVFEPKMTRSKLKEVVEKGVVIPTWTISPMKKPNELKPPQFVDIPLEEEDSSDEEYCPDEDEEDETAEETFLESDIESTASSPRGSRSGLARAIMEGDDDRSCSPTQRSHKSRHLRVEVVPMGPPPPPQPAGPPRPPRAPPECSFMEKLHAVEEELAISPICLEPYQNLSGGGGEEGGLMACRTRSKRPLRDVPLGRLEAELRAPDITPDMYDCGSAPEDREWTNWLQGLMTSDMENEEEGDDDDDPEYNFLEDIDEPDVEDYRNDRAVRITKKEVSELMEELFETFRDELGVQDQDEEGHEEEEEREEEAPSQEAPNFNIPQTIRFEEPLANLLTERHRTVREQLAALRRHRALLESQAAEAAKNGTPPQVLLLPPSCALMLTHPQKQQLQQQIQQHVQLLTQVHMLSGPVEALQSEVVTTRLFLSELESFAQRGEQARGTMEPGYVSIFRACNLQGALSLLEELKQCPASPASAPTKPVRSAKRGSSLPLLPPKLAWLLATRPVFLYPELLPLCSLDPALHAPRTNSIHTRGEDSLLVLGLRNFSGTMSPYQLVCEYLIRCKEPKQLRRRVFDLSQRRAPDNVIKFYVRQKMVPPMPLACGKVKPDEQRPPVERELKIMPMWLQKSVPFIHKAVMDYNSPTQDGPPQMMTNTAPYTFPPGIRYPPELPETLTLHPSGFRRLRPPSILPNSTPLGQECITEGMGQTIQACAENSTQPVSSRKFLPIKPAPPKPPPPPPKPLQVLTISAGGAVSMLELERGSKTVDKPGAVHHGLPATVIINMAAPLATTVICPARVSEGLARPQGAVARPSTTFAQPRNLGRPLLPAPPKQNPSENGPPICPENATKTNSKPESVSNAETTLILRSPEQVISSVDKLGKEGRTELSISPQKLSAPVGLSAQAPVALSNGSGEAVELRVVQNHLPAISHALAPAPAGGPKNLLLRSTSEGGSHLIFVPQNCVIAEATLPNITAVAQIGRPSPGHVGGSQQGTARHPRKGSAMSPKPDLQNEAKLVEETAPRLASVNPTSRKEKIGQGEGIEGLEEGGEDEEEEEGQYGGDEEEEEEEVGDLGGSPLALSESSESAVSSPGTLQRMEEEEGEGWSGLLASTPQHSPHRGEPGQRGQEWRTTKEEGLTDNIKDGEEDKEEEEVMSLASEESELSVPELQETMEKLSMLASEGMSFGEGDKNDPNSPNSPGSVLSHASPNSSVSQNPKETEGLCEGEEPMHREGGSYKSAGKGVSSRGKRRGAGRGRDQSEVKRDGSGCRPHQRLTHRGRKKQGRRGMSKPTPPLNEDDARDSDLAMESQDMAFAQAYLRRVCAAVWEAPGKVDEFLRVLYEFQQGGDRSSLVGLFGQLKSVLKDWPELLQDFAAFLQPEQARECGLLVEQQAFERSRRFLRQLEMSFEESPAHFQRIVHALQEGPSLTPAGLREMKSQIASLLKNHTHLQTEFWEFFDDIIASSQSVCPEGVAPSDATASQRPRRGARRRLNEVTHPVSEEGEESQKLGTPKKEEGPVCDWSVGGKDRPYRGSKRAAKPRRVSRKHGSVSRRKRGELSSPGSSTLPRGLHPEKRVGRRGEERRKGGNGVNIPHPAKEREEETEDVREKKEQEASQHEGRGGAGDDTPASQPNSVNSSPNPPVCAQNVSLMPTGEKVILWTREADRMILTACQQKGAKHSTFKTVSTQLGNKTANEVSLRFQELMRLFHTTSHPARDADHQAASDDDPD